MSSTFRRLFPLALVSLLVILLAALPGMNGTAQDSPTSAPPSVPAGYGFNPSTGEVLHGLADLARAKGELAVKLQEAERQRLENRMKQFEVNKEQWKYWEWEKDWRSLEEVRIREREEYRKLLDSLTNPPQTRILSGDALNSLLTRLKDCRDLMPGGSVLVQSEWLRGINVTSGEAGNLGLLKLTPLPWPMMLQRPEFTPRCQRIEALLERIRRQALEKGTVPAADWEALAREVACSRTSAKPRTGKRGRPIPSGHLRPVARPEVPQ